MTNLSDQERAVLKAGEELANAAQAVVEAKPDSSILELTTALHNFRVAQVLLDKELAKELESMSRQHDLLLARAHGKIFTN